MSADFKEAVLAPSGFYVVLREAIGRPGWVVRVLDFALWKHREFRFPDEASARTEFTRWVL